jgi:hypothetical protein
MNERYSPDIALAGFLYDVPRASLAAVIDTEAAKVKGIWDPESFNPKSEAYGLTQFLESTWELQAKKSGTFLNQYANAAGYIGADNKVTNMEDLLSLRANPTLSIVAAADLDTQEFRNLGRVGVINPSALAPDQQAWFMYLGHHEGTPGAQQVWEGTMPSAGRAGAEVRFVQNVPPSQQAELLSRYNNDYVQAYRYWIMDYINTHIDPSRFR